MQFFGGKWPWEEQQRGDNEKEHRGGGRRLGLLLFVLLLVSMFEFKALQHSGSLLPIGRSEATILYTLVALSRVTFLLKRLRCLCQRIGK